MLISIYLSIYPTLMAQLPVLTGNTLVKPFPVVSTMGKHISAQSGPLKGASLSLFSLHLVSERSDTSQLLSSSVQKPPQ